MGAPQAISDRNLPNKYHSDRNLRRCTSRKRDNIVLIDVDNDDFGNVIVLDVPESFKKRFRKKPKNVISIDDDDEDDDGGGESSDGACDTNNGASTSNRCCPTVAAHPSTSASAAEGRLFGNEGNTPVKFSKSKRTYSGKSISRNRYGLNPDSEGCSSESDCSDCELMEGSAGILREQWEKASRKRNGYSSVPPDFDDEAGTAAPSHNFQDITSEEGIAEDPQPPGEQSNLKNCSMHLDDSAFPGSPEEFSDGTEDLVSSSGLNSLITDRQKIKETEEYKHAMEEELAARKQQLLQQAEEARRLRNRKKAENMRIRMNERRQRERLEEIRQTRIRDEENSNIKEKHRAEIKKELHRIEAMCGDMASLLRCLGIHVSDGPFPSPHEVQVAYKRACLKFHPDRISASDLRQQVEAEEKFKLISNMKDKFSF